MRLLRISPLLAAAWFASMAAAVELDLTSTASVNSALSLLAEGLMNYYNGDTYGGTPGMFVAPYYWWEAGAAWGSMLDYWYYTGDTQYNAQLKEALLFQVGQNADYMPSNQTTTEGNDDQGFWGVTVMAAAEKNFSNPADDQPQWLALAQAVFNTMASRWDTGNCGGGLRWQIYTWNSGYDYKNSVANGCLFNIASRLARYTGNDSYADWAEKVWDWMTTVNFLDNTTNVLVDGASIDNNCQSLSMQEWTYNYGLFTSGAAFMFDHTKDDKWLTRAEGLLTGGGIFFSNNVMFEQACQASGKCNTDQRCFKAIYSRFLGLTAQMCPTLADTIMGYLQGSAAAAAQSCSGGTDGHTCGLNWQVSGWDGVFGLGEQMSALEVIQNTMATSKPKPFTNSTGGTSKGNAAAGTNPVSSNFLTNTLTISGKDKFGAAIITVLLSVGIGATGWWMLKEHKAFGHI